MESQNGQSTSRGHDGYRTWSHFASTVALGTGLIAVAVFALVEKAQIDALTQQDAVHQQNIVELQSRVATADAALAGTVGNLQDQLASEEARTSESIEKAQSDALRHTDATAQKLKKNVEKQASEQQDALDARIADARSEATDASTKADHALNRIDNVGAAVDVVKSDLASARTAGDNTASDLQTARGDMGVMSGLIATNSKQIQQLRDMGDRNIYEFTIRKSGGLQKTGDVQIRLAKSDPKRSMYTMVVLANDKLIDKKDKTSNEPVQFYAGPGSRVPDEVVVNDVGKDSIQGYLATPKITTASR